MKKNFLLLIISLLTLTSCTINSVTTYHKDNSTSMLMDIDMKDALALTKGMLKDSASEGNKLKELELFPKDWTNMYQFMQEESTKTGKKLPKDEDSIKLFKKMFIKSNYDGEEMKGISMKFDRISQQEMKNFYKGSQANNFLNATSSDKTFWDGKKLSLDTEYFNPKDFSKALELKLKEKDGNEGDKEEIKDVKQTLEQTKAMMKMMNMKFTNQIKFETKIKSITGKHDWIKQIDDYTIDMSFSFEDLFDDSIKLQNADPKIEIITE